jgi:hypothetical protein
MKAKIGFYIYAMFCLLSVGLVYSAVFMPSTYTFTAGGCDAFTKTLGAAGLRLLAAPIVYFLGSGIRRTLKQS